jgi:hypothetical protein
MAEWFLPLRDAARWIWLPHAEFPFGTERDQVALFHGAIVPPPGTQVVELHVSAEGRYTVWLNDSDDPLGHGPARTDSIHRTLDNYAIDISGASDKTLHVWAQVRWRAGAPEIPLAEMQGSLPGLLVIALFLDKDGQILGKTGTGAKDGAWLARRCTGLRGSPMVGVPGYVAVGQFEHQNSSGWPADWRKAADPSDAGWAAPSVHAAPYFKQDPHVPTGPGSFSWLIRREIAHTEYRALPIWETRKLVKSQAPVSPDAPPSHEPVNSLTGLKLGPNETVTLRCDVGHYAIGYYRMRLGGKGTKLAVTSSEVLSGGLEPSTADANHMVRTKKAFTLDSPLEFIPFTDTYTLDTTEPRTMEASHWRAFRFLELTLTAGPDGGELDTFTLHATGYPFEPDYAFEAAGTTTDAAEIVRKMVDVSWRTLKSCTWETYMDCPYYEQLQYIGDTRLQCLITYMTTGDTTLPVQALRAFDRSRITEGITQSRYPSQGMQLIPTFSLIYILMIEDYMKFAGDDAIVAEVRPGIGPILNWFAQHSDHETGLVGYVPYWPFVDWVNGWDIGIPQHGGKAPGFSEKRFTGANACVNLFYLMALQSAANIYESTKSGSGNFYNSRATALRQRIKDTFYDAGRGLVCDVPLEVGRGKLGVWSQHAQALAVLADLLSPTEAREAMRISLDPKNAIRPDEKANDVEGMKAGKYEGRYIAPASLYFLFYVAEALARLRMGEHIWPILAPFRAALERGSTTWPESYEPSRSECHAWSAWPLYFFARHLLGIAPPSLEDNKVRVQPLHCPPLTTAKGHFQTHRGPVNVQVAWDDGQRQVSATGLGVEVVGE